MSDARPRHETMFQTVSDTLKASVGHILFTVSHALPGGQEVERIFTNMPADYPTGGRKPVVHSDWNDFMATGECFVATRPEEFGPHFQDLDTIVALGFGSVINIPVIHQGRMLGSLNLLDREGCYHGDVAPACRSVHDQAVQAYLAYEAFATRQST